MMKKVLGMLLIATLLFATACSSAKDNPENNEFFDERLQTELSDDEILYDETKNKQYSEPEYAPVDVSTDLNKFEFAVNGKKLTLPCTPKELHEAAKTKAWGMEGWSNEDITTFTLDPLTSTLYKYGIDRDGSRYIFIHAEGLNKTNEPMLASECSIYKISQELDDVKENSLAPIVYFPGNIHVGMKITADELTTLLGAPTYTGETFLDEPSFTWETELYSFYITITDDTITYVYYIHETEKDLVPFE